MSNVCNYCGFTEGYCTCDKTDHNQEMINFLEKDIQDCKNRGVPFVYYSPQIIEKILDLLRKAQKK